MTEMHVKPATGEGGARTIHEARPLMRAKGRGEA
jgi:hypothetical protein